MIEGAPFLRLLQLSSPGLPVGGYAYSHGLEQAVTAGTVHDEASAADWILGVTEHAIAPLVVPVLGRLLDARAAGDPAAVAHWEAFLCAARETSELALEDSQMGRSLARLLASLDVEEAASYRRADDVSYVALYALACAHWQVPRREAQQAALFTFCENQVVAAMKVVPLGQTAGQRVLVEAMARIPAWVQHCDGLDDDDIGPAASGLAMACARHEQQYTRLFRS